MALNPKPGRLKAALLFKRIGKEQHKRVPAGTAVKYYRDPINPGQFILAHGKLHYARVDALALPDTVEAVC